MERGIIVLKHFYAKGLLSIIFLAQLDFSKNPNIFIFLAAE